MVAARGRALGFLKEGKMDRSTRAARPWAWWGALAWAWGLALSLAHAEQIADNQAAITLYRSIVQEASSEFTDAGNLATLLTEAKNYDEATTTVFSGIDRFPAKGDYFFQIGLNIVEATGNRDLRAQLKAAVEARDKRD